MEGAREGFWGWGGVEGPVKFYEGPVVEGGASSEDEKTTQTNQSLRYHAPSLSTPSLCDPSNRSPVPLF